MFWRHQNNIKPIQKVKCLLWELALNVVLAFLRFLPRYYGSCYRLQHVEKKTQKRHVKEQTCQTVGTCRKEKKGERRQKKRKGAKIARCLIKKLSRLRSILYFSYQLLEPSKHFCTLSWGAYSTNFHLFFLRNISIIIYIYHYSWVSKHSGKDQGPTGKVLSISAGRGQVLKKKVG